ncbi:CPBP family intramembrane metalloprotease domain-containing protein [Enemella evansiae]|uniref:CPBP family intramembrane glutamic endopeptidase n=1 Tax=Enemella evansiae TaxID=2016499 RepID=UPI000B9669FB|nr:CPBP family intramembrane glutamic endopeptidase [Enemella evansiae]OYO03224.1 CPBP family intramembrane metalloprotease domain-containing protein [Enemella evansiae]
MSTAVAAPVGRSGRPLVEMVIVLALSLGQSGVYSVLRIVERLTRDQPLNQQTASMNSSATPDRPWLDLAYQLANLAFPLVPVVLALYLLTQLPGRRAWPGDRIGLPANRRLGFDLTRPGSDLVRGFAIAAAIGIPGLGFYLLARQLGINATVEPANLAENWWTVPVYVLSAAMNGVLEEVLMLGYLFLRFSQWRPTSPAGLVAWLPILIGSALIRGSYHLYQGFGQFIGNVFMGLVSGLLFLRWKRTMPLVIAHTLINIAAFVGYALVAGRVSWL